MATGEVDARTDIYSLGLIVYECLVGQPPFVANTSLQYLSAHATIEPPKLREGRPDAPQALEDLISRCLVKERGERIQSAAEVADGLRRIQARLEAGADLATPPPKRPAEAPEDAPSTAIDALLQERPESRPRFVTQPQQVPAPADTPPRPPPARHPVPAPPAGLVAPGVVLGGGRGARERPDAGA